MATWGLKWIEGHGSVPLLMANTCQTPQFPVTFDMKTNGFIYSKFHKDPEKSSRIMIRLDDASLISSGSFLMVVMKLRLVDFRFASGPGFAGFAGFRPAG